MGLFDILKGQRDDVKVTRSALDEARDPGGEDEGMVNELIAKVLSIGIEGKGPFDSASAVAEEAIRDNSSANQAVNEVIRKHVAGGAMGGFATSLGGFVTMPVALPVNILEFYVQATRMVASIAKIRGYDLSSQEIRTAVLLTLVGSGADEMLARAGLTTTSGRLASLASKNLPRSALMMVNKAVGFRLLRTAGEQTLARFGRAVPLVGGAVGGALDAYLMKQIADNAKEQFPAR